jgi:hypothetical protein
MDHNDVHAHRETRNAKHGADPIRFSELANNQEISGLFKYHVSLLPSGNGNMTTNQQTNKPTKQKVFRIDGIWQCFGGFLINCHDAMIAMIAIVDKAYMAM